MTQHQLTMRNTTCRKLVFVVIAVVAAYRASLQVATAQSGEHPTTLQWNAAKLCEKALQKKYPPTRASVDSGKRVVLNIDHAQLSDISGDPCFRIALHNWAATGDVSIQLIGPKGEIVPVVPTERPIHASPEGSGTVTVPYKHRGLYPGLWLLMASGPCGIHECKVEIPKVLPLDGNRKEERLVFKTRNTLSSSLPYHFGVYEPPSAKAPNPPAPLAPPAIDENASALERKELERINATATSTASDLSSNSTQTSGDLPSLSEQSHSRNTNENEGGPPDAIVEGKLKILNLAGKSYKRGEPLISTRGQIPRGTVLYPIRISMLAAAGSEVSDLYFFKDEFKEWKCLWRQMGRIF